MRMLDSARCWKAVRDSPCVQAEDCRLVSRFGFKLPKEFKRWLQNCNIKHQTISQAEAQQLATSSTSDPGDPASESTSQPLRPCQQALACNIPELGRRVAVCAASQ